METCSRMGHSFMTSRVTLGPGFPKYGMGSTFLGSKDRKHLVSLDINVGLKPAIFLRERD